MDTSKKQQGISFISLLFTLIFLGLIVIFGLRMFPLYYDYYAVRDIVQQVADETGSTNAPAMQIWRKVDKHLQVNSIDYLKSEDFSVNRTKSGNELVLKYDARTPYLWNIDLIAKFEIKATPK